MDDAGRPIELISLTDGSQATIPMQWSRDGDLQSWGHGTEQVVFRIDALRQLKSVEMGTETTSYSYDAFGSRVGQVSSIGSANQFVHGMEVGGLRSIQLEKNLATGEGKHYTFGAYPDDLLGSHSSSEGAQYFLSDRQFSVTSIVSGSGDLSQSQSYSAYGVPHSQSSRLAMPSFQGRPAVTTSGKDVLNFRSRAYLPELGRFASRDTYPGSADEPLSRNRYTFVNNAPSEFLDPTGHAATVLPAVGLILAGIAMLYAAVSHFLSEKDAGIRKVMETSPGFQNGGAAGSPYFPQYILNVISGLAVIGVVMAMAGTMISLGAGVLIAGKGAIGLAGLESGFRGLINTTAALVTACYMGLVFPYVTFNEYFGSQLIAFLSSKFSQGLLEGFGTAAVVLVVPLTGCTAASRAWLGAMGWIGG